MTPEQRLLARACSGRLTPDDAHLVGPLAGVSVNPALARLIESSPARHGNRDARAYVFALDSGERLTLVVALDAIPVEVP